MMFLAYYYCLTNMIFEYAYSVQRKKKNVHTYFWKMR